MIIYRSLPLCPPRKVVIPMLFMFELLLAIIIVAVRHYLKNKRNCRVKIKRIMLKAAATVLALLLAFTVLLQELIQRMLDQISIQQKKLRHKDRKK